MFNLYRYRAGVVAAGTVVLALGLGACRGDDEQRARSAVSEAGDRTAAAADQAKDAAGNAWITTKIQAQFFADQDVKGRNIDVTTRDGVVTLSGQVESEPARQRAVEIARQTEGVQRVDDQLSVGAGERAAAGETPVPAAPAPAAPAPGTVEPDRPAATTGTGTLATEEPAPSTASAAQADPLARIQSQFFSRPSIRHSDIGVNASGGVVTLTGRARSESLRQEALSIARSTPGVERVEDRIQVDASAPAPTAGEMAPVPPATSAAPAAPGMQSETLAVEQPRGDEWIEAQIQSRFFRDPLVKNASVTVRASNGTVTLDGQVPSQEAREKALELAREVDGVGNVVDKLTVGR